MAARIAVLTYDFLVVGAGVAGLRAAIELSAAGSVLVVAKDSLRESSSEYAQGGIAAALGDDDEIELHEQDTLAAGDGLCSRGAVRVLVEDAPRVIEELIGWGAEFDRDGAHLAFAREGAHSRNRILHSRGDSTGHEIARTLARKAASIGAITLRSFRATTDLLVENGEVSGAMLWDGESQQPMQAAARAVLLATGGLGRVFRDTTNPDVATGDGVAMAWRAGARIGDIEFVQFHPTALAVAGAPRFLLSEALRGEGAHLINLAGVRFTDELAPRDVVSRAIVAEMRRTGAPHVLLDLTHRGAEFIRRRFPRIHETCLRHGVDISAQPAPVHPAAHYAMGGVVTDLWGRTSLPRLYAAGETACTGVHGANRLASNSLLEGLVFGARAGAAMRECAGSPRGGQAPLVELPDISEDALRDLTSSACGITRCGPELEDAVRALQSTPMVAAQPSGVTQYELRNIHAVALLIARCALGRRESRGAHYRTDYPARLPEFEKHSQIQLGHDVIFS